MGCITSGRGGTESAGRNGEGFVMREEVESAQ